VIDQGLATSAADPSGRQRAIRLAAFTTSALILAYGATVLLLTWTAVSGAGRVGADFRLYLDAATGLLSGHPLYPQHQVAGPYVVADGDILYPPPIVLLMLPFAILPAILFWVAPLGIIAAAVVHHRPAVWSWPLLALGVAYPVTSLKIVHGNPTMWIVAAIALGTITAGPAVAVLLKPTLAPFAVIGANRRRWWIALGIAAAAGALFAPLWPDYAAVLANSRGPGIFYSLDEVPFAVVPVIAWLASPSFEWPASVRRVANHRNANIGERKPAR
jgi:hypothetical protein